MKQDIGELLRENGQISEREFKEALRAVETTGEPTARALLRLGFVTEENLKTILELHYGVNYLDLKKMAPDAGITALIRQDLVQQYQIVPAQRAGNRLTLAMVTPSDIEALNKAKEYLNDWQLNVAVCTNDGFQNFVSRAYVSVPPKRRVDNQVAFIELMDGAGNDNLLSEDRFGTGVAENRAMILLSHHIIANAISKGCTNIHIEPNERQVLVHYRKEGVLFPARRLPKSILPELVQRFKIMAAQAADEVVLPYDGLLNVRHGQTDFSFRLSIVPGAFGEHLVIWLG